MGLEKTNAGEQRPRIEGKTERLTSPETEQEIRALVAALIDTAKGDTAGFLETTTESTERLRSSGADQETMESLKSFDREAKNLQDRFKRDLEDIMTPDEEREFVQANSRPEIRTLSRAEELAELQTRNETPAPLPEDEKIDLADELPVHESWRPVEPTATEDVGDKAKTAEANEEDEEDPIDLSFMLKEGLQTKMKTPASAEISQQATAGVAAPTPEMSRNSENIRESTGSLPDSQKSSAAYHLESYRNTIDSLKGGSLTPAERERQLAELDRIIDALNDAGLQEQPAEPDSIKSQKIKELESKIAVREEMVATSKRLGGELEESDFDSLKELKKELGSLKGNATPENTASTGSVTVASELAPASDVSKDFETSPTMAPSAFETSPTMPPPAAEIFADDIASADTIPPPDTNQSVREVISDMDTMAVDSDDEARRAAERYVAAAGSLRSPKVPSLESFGLPPLPDVNNEEPEEIPDADVKSIPPTKEEIDDATIKNLDSLNREIDKEADLGGPIVAETLRRLDEFNNDNPTIKTMPAEQPTPRKPESATEKISAELDARADAWTERSSDFSPSLTELESSTNPADKDKLAARSTRDALLREISYLYEGIATNDDFIQELGVDDSAKLTAYNEEISRRIQDLEKRLEKTK